MFYADADAYNVICACAGVVRGQTGSATMAEEGHPEREKNGVLTHPDGQVCKTAVRMHACMRACVRLRVLTLFGPECFL